MSDNFDWDPYWDGSDDGLDTRPRTTTIQDHDSETEDAHTEEEICDAIRANEAACDRRAWYDAQSGRDLRQFIVERGIDAPGKILRSKGSMIDAIMAQYTETALREAARGREEDAKRRAWYGEQSDVDLWQFITKRNIALPFNSGSSQAPEEVMIDALMAQDKKMQFPFMKLPAELRNRIYFHLLVDPAQQTDVVEKPRIKCYPNILAVCSYIRREASNVLYANAHVTLDLKFYYANAYFKVDCIRPPARKASPTVSTRGQRAQQALFDNPAHFTLGNQVQVQVQQMSNHHVQQILGNQSHQAPIGPPPPTVDPPVQSTTEADVRRAASILHNEIISQVGRVTIHIAICHRVVLESYERTTEVRQIVTELKDYMAKHAGRQQNVCVTFDLEWASTGGGTRGGSSEAYKKNPTNKQHIFNDAFKMLEPFSQIGESKDYGHLAGCQKMEVTFMVSNDIDEEVVEKLEGKKQEVEKQCEEKKLGPTTIGCLVRTQAQVLQKEIDSRVTESIFKRHWREDTWSHEPDNEDCENHAYTLSPKKKAGEDNLWDADLGKDDDSVQFDSDGDEVMQDDEDGELFNPEDLEDEDYDLDDLIVDATPAAEPIAFHPDLEENREIKEWLKNGGFRSELNNIREARVLALDQKIGSSEQQEHSLFGNN